ncbi:sn-1-specific diacylglycerol lipase ABHD11 isoform X2 [Parasteatoda tepidariorum]
MHGMALTKEDWGDIPQITANATGRMVFAIDARSHGDSDWVDVFDFEINVDDLLLFMDRMDIKKAILVGHNMGALTAMKAAFRNPDRVEKLVVEEMPIRRYSNTLISTWTKFFTLAKEGMRRIHAGSSMDEAKEILANYVFDHLPQKQKFENECDPSDGRLALKQKDDGSFEFKCNQDIVLPNFQDINNDLQLLDRSYRETTCFIYGQNSPNLIGQDEYEIKKFFPSAKLFGISDASHEVHKKYPLPFTEALLVFIQGGWNKKMHTRP